MKAMTITAYGESATFEAADLSKPTATQGHVVIRIAASSVNTVDTMIRSMGVDLPLSPALPAVLGMDFAGVIEGVGEGVAEFSVGDEVYGCAGGLADIQGALAEFMLADSKLIAHKPKSISMREAAAMPLVGITAYEGLERAGITAGQKVLIQGGAGGVGHLALQLAKHFGADVYGTGTGEDQLEVIKGYGATSIDFAAEKIADYVAEYTDGAGFDLIFDTVGGVNMTNSFEAAALNANLSSTVGLLEIDLSPAHFKGLSLHIIFMLLPMLSNQGREKHGAILAKLAEIVDAGALKPLLDDEVFGLENVGGAYDRLTSGKAIGKVVVDI
ncbi:quinone oxidoreductase [Phaeobacter gallaeciensis]|uniref:Quinone oxidoreductase n=1 Tax=Phaeobacter gallaeciensis TaxID=60890 RepID=A0A366XDI1_9RHOB|nr:MULTISPECIES: zinc-dependent alcohol dehydrogenase family protein [Roseobacteraceae]MBT8167217.1 zinc-dependent alcohol dehydrogenase family protein [Falsiruegeria litorea]RBW62864.1 quinone oxidoreductase [Phaeobacter gallaeciensis]